MSDARAHHRPPVEDRDIRAAKKGSARDAIGRIEPGCEIYILTYGQFSLMDALVVLLEQTGPADVVVSSWTAGSADLTRSAKLLENAAITRMRFVVDRSFLTRQPEYCAKMRRLFGDECIRTTRSHCKFATIQNDDWTIAVRTSMNLNENPRLENLEISDDPALCAFMATVADDLFQEQQAGLFEGELPELKSVENVERAGEVAMGHVQVDSSGPVIGPRTP